jgi:ribosome biogenesis GTPase A
MLAGLRTLSEKVLDTDLIVETRDARIPLSSRNPFLEDVCANRRRLVLYNKRDLAGLTSVQENVYTPESGKTDYGSG